jgi:predicted nucleic-acid-binding protein
MKVKPVILDANAVIHFLLAYDMSKFKVVVKTLNTQQCNVPIEVIAETVYILDDKYQLDRQTIAAKLKDFIIIQDNLVTETNAVTFGLNLFASSKFDFVDCLLTGYAKVNGYPVLTFDTDLKKELAEQDYLVNI